MKNYKVLVTAPPILPKVEYYKKACLDRGVELCTPDIEVKEALDQKELNVYLKGIDAILCGDDELNFNVLKKATDLKVISKWGTGIDTIDSNAARELGIKVLRVKDAFGSPLSDTVLSYILLISRKILEKDSLIREHDWKKIPSYTLSERSIGIIGLGHIGKAVARKAYALGMKVYFNDIAKISLKEQEKEYVFLELEELLSVSNFISIHCDLNDSSFHLIDKEELRLMDKDSIIINTSRGSIINEKELIIALEKNLIGGAALDVFETEPLPRNSKLRNFKNVFLSPHNSNASPETFKEVDKKAIKNVFIGLGLNEKGLNLN